MEKEFFRKNVLFVDVDGLRQVNTYRIMAEYDVRHDIPEPHYKIEYRLIDEFTMTWQEIERDGGVSQVNEDLKECYNLVS